LSWADVDGRGERDKVVVLIDPRYGLRDFAVETIGDLTNALHIAGDGLAAQRARLLANLPLGQPP
jgi:hypothetical protein